jgi:hypothetical protein
MPSLCTICRDRFTIVRESTPPLLPGLDAESAQRDSERREKNRERLQQRQKAKPEKPQTMFTTASAWLRGDAKL